MGIEKKTTTEFDNARVAVERRHDPELTQMLNAEPGLCQETDEEGKNLLIHAAVSSSLDAFKMIGRRTEQLNQRDKSGHGALHYLVAKDKSQHIEALFENDGVDKELQNFQQTTPVSFAASYNSTESLAILLMYDPNLDTPNQNGQTPLQIACLSSSPNIASALLAKGADAKLSDFEGRTALHYLAQNGLMLSTDKQQLLEQLYNANADLDAVTLDGHSVMDYANLTDDHEFAIALQKLQNPELADVMERILGLTVQPGPAQNDQANTQGSSLPEHQQTPLYQRHQFVSSSAGKAPSPRDDKDTPANRPTKR